MFSLYRTSSPIYSILCVSALLLSACQNQTLLSHHKKNADSLRKQSTFELDRQAILSMAGSYSVDFTFRETIAVRPGYLLAEPYQTGGIEWITVLEDSGDRIALQHVLVACSEQQSPSEEQQKATFDEHCFPIKHWRQDWVYEDTKLLEFSGDNQWKNTTLGHDIIQNTWSQAVYQVDDSPRYESYGHWQHEANQSVWQSNSTWRPLPRREYSKRNDYDILVGINRHVVTPNGWYHEQDNYKLDRQHDDQHPVIAREYGLNRYEPIDRPELHLANQYMQETHHFWAAVRSYWNHKINSYKTFNIESEVADTPMYERLFELASEYKYASTTNTQQMQQQIDSALAIYVYPQNHY